MFLYLRKKKSAIADAVDAFIAYTTLLVNGRSPVNSSKNIYTDASSQNLSITPSSVNYTTRHDLANPFAGLGNYSVAFDGSISRLLITSNTGDIGTTFTIDAWVYPTSYTNGACIIGGTAGTLPMLRMSGTAGAWSFGNFTTPDAVISTTKLPLNQWSHISVVRTGTGTNQTFLYQNGVKVATGTSSDAFTTTGQMQIGAYSASGYFPGYISNLRLVKGYALYSDNFKPSTSPLTAVTGTILLTCNSSSLKDYSASNNTVTVTGAMTITNNNPFIVSGKNGSVYFDGSTSSLSAPNNSANNFGTGDFTIEWWMKCKVAWNTMTNPGVIGQKRDDGTNGWQIYRNGASNVNEVNIRITQQNDYPSLATPTTGVWEHWAVTRQNGTLRWFKNGALTNTIAGVTQDVTDTVGQLYHGYTQTWGGWFNGSLSNVRVVKGTALYTAAFTPSKLALTAVSGTTLLSCQDSVVDNSPTGQVFTAGVNATFSCECPVDNGGVVDVSGGNASGFFDLTNYLTVTDPSNIFSYGAGDFTIEGFMYLTSTAVNQYIFSSQNNSAYNTNVDIWFNTSSKTLNLQTGSTVLRISGSTVLTTGVWYHFAVSRVSGQTKLFVDGVQQGSTYADTNVYVAPTPGPMIGAYAYGAGSLKFSGYLSNIRVVKGTGLYSSAFTPPSSALQAIPGTVLLTLQTPASSFNNAFIDKSQRNALVTRYAGNPAPGAFSPYSANGWSSYFDGASCFTAAANAAFAAGTGDFTVETWVNIPTGGGGYVMDTDATGTAGNVNRMALYLDNGQVTLYSGSANVITATGTNLIPANTWTHVAWVRVANSLSVYVNGVKIGSSVTFSNNLSNTNFYLAQNRAASKFTGSMSNFRFVKGTGVYTAAFTPSKTALTVVSGTSILTFQDNYFKDNSSNAFTLTITGAPAIRPDSPFRSGKAYTPALHGGSCYFDGTNTSAISLPSAGWHNKLGGLAWTLDFWMYPTAYGTASVFKTLFGNAVTSQSIGWRVEINATSIVFTNNNTATAVTTTIPIKAWTHIAFTHDGTNLKLYKNGVYITSAAVTLASNSDIINIGRAGNATNYFPYQGYISDARMTHGSTLYSYNFNVPTAPAKARADTVMFMNFTDAAIVDYSARYNVVTNGNSVALASSKKYNSSSLYFDGTGDSIPVTDSVGLELTKGDFTIEAWVNPTATASDKKIIVKRANASEYAQFDFTINGSTGYPRFIMSVSGTAWDLDLNSTTNICDGNWHHVAVTRYGNVFTLWIDGVSRVSVTNSITLKTSTANVTIGALTDNSFPYLGYMDDVRVSKGLARYTSNFVPPSRALELM